MVIDASDIRPDWCPGCGNFGILSAIISSVSELNLKPHETVVVSGIGCSSKTPHFIKVNGIHTIHGRALPFATGIKLMNPELNVICVGGDGDCYSIGACHFINAPRKNIDITYIVFNNGVYGLTKGQASPTLHRGIKTKGIPSPVRHDAINPVAVAIASGYTFVARGYSLKTQHLKELIKQGLLHKGTSFIDVLQPCPTYNDITTKEWYEERIYEMKEHDYNVPSIKREDMEKHVLHAIAKAMEWEDRIPIGIFYKNVHVPVYKCEVNKTKIDDIYNVLRV